MNSPNLDLLTLAADKIVDWAQHARDLSELCDFVHKNEDGERFASGVKAKLVDIAGGIEKRALRGQVVTYGQMTAIHNMQKGLAGWLLPNPKNGFKTWDQQPAFAVAV